MRGYSNADAVSVSVGIHVQHMRAGSVRREEEQVHIRSVCFLPGGHQSLWIHASNASRDCICLGKQPRRLQLAAVSWLIMLGPITIIFEIETQFW